MRGREFNNNSVSSELVLHIYIPLDNAGRTLRIETAIHAQATCTVCRPYIFFFQPKDLYHNGCQKTQHHSLYRPDSQWDQDFHCPGGIRVSYYPYVLVSGICWACLLISAGTKRNRLPYTVKKIDMSKNTQKEPWFLEINPNGRIPAITDTLEDGTTINVWESGSILQYLVEQYDKDYKISYPKGTREAYEVNNWLFFQNAGVCSNSTQNQPVIERSE